MISNRSLQLSLYSFSIANQILMDWSYQNFQYGFWAPGVSIASGLMFWYGTRSPSQKISILKHVVSLSHWSNLKNKYISHFWKKNVEIFSRIWFSITKDTTQKENIRYMILNTALPGPCLDILQLPSSWSEIRCVDFKLKPTCLIFG